MLQEIIELQNSAVEKLLDLTRANTKKAYTFRAPTGSGKTYMMADYMNRLLQVNPNVELPSTPSSPLPRRENT